MQNKLKNREDTVSELNDGYQASLDQLRDEIDALDREIAQKLKERSAIVARVGLLKTEYGIQGSYIRPRREAVMLRDLMESFKGSLFPREAVAHIWRTIIGASTSMESPLNLSVLCDGENTTPYMLGREYFGSYLPGSIHQRMENVMEDMQNSPHTVAVVPYGNTSQGACWWQLLADNDDTTPPVVFAIIPFTEDVQSALAIGRVEIMPTGDDETLYALSSPEASQAQDWQAWLDAISPRPLSMRFSSDGKQVLLTLKGFFYGDEQQRSLIASQLTSISGQPVDVTCIGAYATPYTLPKEDNT